MLTFLIVGSSKLSVCDVVKCTERSNIQKLEDTALVMTLRTNLCRLTLCVSCDVLDYLLKLQHPLLRHLHFEPLPPLLHLQYLLHSPWHLPLL